MTSVLLSKMFRKGCDGGKVVISIIILFLGVRIITFIQNFVVWFYTSLPRPLVHVLDTFYFRSTLMQRLFSFRLLDTTTISGSRTVAEDLARKVGLSFESHTVTTKDGYMLTLHRCYLPTQSTSLSSSSMPLESSRPPVLLMHGFMQVRRNLG
jgi:hypothetical protein